MGVWGGHRVGVLYVQGIRAKKSHQEIHMRTLCLLRLCNPYIPV